jgi:hypothetical protein
LKLAARTPWVEVDQARINPIQAHMDADPATVLGVLREMKAAGKGIIGMKILGQGALSDQVDRAIAYAGKLDVLDAFTIGFGSYGQFEEIATKLPPSRSLVRAAARQARRLDWVGLGACRRPASAGLELAAGDSTPSGSPGRADADFTATRQGSSGDRSVTGSVASGAALASESSGAWRRLAGGSRRGQGDGGGCHLRTT